MSTHYEVRYTTNPRDFKAYDTTRIREDFLIQGLFQPDQVRWCYTHYDRFMAGSAVPVSASLSLEAIDPLKADFFLQRRELGVINIGQAGTITVDGQAYTLQHKEALYVGMGVQNVEFASVDAAQPAKFYMTSAPAHQAFPTKLITREDAEVVETGSLDTSNARTIRKLIVNSVVEVNQLQMGMTELKPGSIWNTMPAHTHDRRMEIYLYFDVTDGQAVCHFMGQPEETRHIWMHNEEAVISPPWSIHSGAGTGSYTFIWAMAGENLDYGDMDTCTPLDLK
ncbi:MAG: 5-dehydro-4-deoxy-D-glucuronate isomerase [Bacteroidota bacterium]